MASDTYNTSPPPNKSSDPQTFMAPLLEQQRKLEETIAESNRITRQKAEAEAALAQSNNELAARQAEARDAARKAYESNDNLTHSIKFMLAVIDEKLGWAETVIEDDRTQINLIVRELRSLQIRIDSIAQLLAGMVSSIAMVAQDKGNAVVLHQLKGYEELVKKALDRPDVILGGTNVHAKRDVAIGNDLVGGNSTK